MTISGCTMQTVLLICGFVCVACAQFPGGGPLTEYYIKGTNFKGPTCNSTSQAGFVDGGEHGAIPDDQLLSVPFGDSTSTTPVVQQIISKAAGYIVSRLLVSDYNGVNHVFYCGDAYNESNLYVVDEAVPLSLETFHGRTGIRGRNRSENTLSTGGVNKPIVCSIAGGQPRQDNLLLSVDYADGRTLVIRPLDTLDVIVLRLKGFIEELGKYTCIAGNKANKVPERIITQIDLFITKDYNLKILPGNGPFEESVKVGDKFVGPTCNSTKLGPGFVDAGKDGTSIGIPVTFRKEDSTKPQIFQEVIWENSVYRGTRLRISSYDGTTHHFICKHSGASGNDSVSVAALVPTLLTGFFVTPQHRADIADATTVQADSLLQPIGCAIETGYPFEGKLNMTIKFQDGTVIVKRPAVGERSIIHKFKGTRRDAGVYTCRAGNRANPRQQLWRFRLHAPGVPSFRNTMRNVTVQEGETLSLNCTVSDLPEATLLTVTRNGTTTSVLSRYQSAVAIEIGQGLQVPILVVDAVKMSDAGVYECTAGNALGRAAVEVTLNVSERPPGGLPGGPRDGPNPNTKYYIIGGVIALVVVVSLVVTAVVIKKRKA